GGAGETVAAFRVVEREAHALAAATGGGFDHYRIADLAGDLHRVLGSLDLPGVTGNRRDFRLLREAFRFDLVAHGAHRMGQGADERDTGSRERLGERRLLREETEARMHGIGAGTPARLHDRYDVEVCRDRRRPRQLDRFVGIAHGETFRIDRVVNGDAWN